MEEVPVSDRTNEKAGFVEESDDSGLLHLHKVTDDLVVEVVNLPKDYENVKSEMKNSSL